MRKIQSFLTKRSQVLIYLITFLLSLNCFAQNNIRIGVRIHPHLALVTKGKNSIVNNKNFSKNFFRPSSINFGLAINYSFSKILLELSSSFYSTKIRLKLHKIEGLKSNFALLDYNTISFSNQLSLGYKIHSGKRYLNDYFLLGSIQYNLAGIYKQRGRGNLDGLNVQYYKENYTTMETNFKTFGFGCEFRIRTFVKQIGKFDYGLGYTFLQKSYPNIGIDAKINSKEYFASLNPKVHLFSFNFIYYLGTKSL